MKFRMNTKKGTFEVLDTFQSINTGETINHWTILADSHHYSCKADYVHACTVALNHWLMTYEGELRNN